MTIADIHNIGFAYTYIINDVSILHNEMGEVLKDFKIV